jgi:tRNA A-37 threonylcarbamoyl transferase component Bud32
MLMPAPATVPELLALVRQSQLADAPGLADYLQRLETSRSLPPAPVDLARLLVRDGFLTRFQAEQLLLGRSRSFLLGKYKILDRLGAGGGGSVYLCEHSQMQRKVAVKVLPPNLAKDRSALERFYREAQAIAALNHPNIVRAYDVDQCDGLHLLVLEYVDGASLQEIVQRRGPLPFGEAADYLCQAALGLQHAHERGLVHRDIKPSNLLVTTAGQRPAASGDSTVSSTLTLSPERRQPTAVVKILDLGLARFFRDEDGSLTRDVDRAAIGTADYMAPEQAVDSHDVDIRADIYSLGCTFYYCLTGRPPFAGNAAQKLLGHQFRTPPPLRQLRPEVPVPLADLIGRMMAKRPQDRPATPASVVAALDPLSPASQRSGAARPPAGGLSRARLRLRWLLLLARQRWRWTALAVVVLLMGCMLLLFVTRHPRDERAEDRPPQRPVDAPALDWSAGFATTNDLRLNGTAKIPPGTTVLRLTDAVNTQAGSAFSVRALPIARFSTQFDFQLTKAQADGFAFVIQGAGSTALGATGAGLGYAGIRPSSAVKFDLYNNEGEGGNSTGLFLNGAMPTVKGVPPSKGRNDLSGTGIDLHSGHVFTAALDYDGSLLLVTIADQTTKATAAQEYRVDIPKEMGAKTGYVGFTGATGGANAIQDILRWRFTPRE